MLAYHANKFAIGMLTPAYFDFLGFGGLLAVVWENRAAQFIFRLTGISRRRGRGCGFCSWIRNAKCPDPVGVGICRFGIEEC